MNQFEQLRPGISFFIRANDSARSVIFDEEIAGLCQKVREHRSIYTAAAEMEMSYGKAWRIIKDAENILGFKLFTREGCKGSNLTDEGNKLLNVYLSIYSNLEDQAERLFEELTGSSGNDDDEQPTIA